jgi:hypothetical protein
MLPKTRQARWVVVAFVLVSLFYLQSTFSNTPLLVTVTLGDAEAEAIPTDAIPTDTDVDDLAYIARVLQEKGLGPNVTYASRTIQYIPDAPDRPSVTEIGDTLFPYGFVTVNFEKENVLPITAPLQIHVKDSPRRDQVNASSMIFGASTTFGRFTSVTTSPMEEWKRWLTDGNKNSNGAGLVLALFNATEEEIEHARKQLHAEGIDATVVQSNSALDMPGRYVDLIEMLYNHPSSNTRDWFVLIDDDTFFPCVSGLVETLSKYDSSKPYYIGTLTERTDWLLANRRPMAYGGGGVFLSRPVARKIVQVDCLTKDEKGDYVVGGTQGDALLYSCLHRYTDLRLTYIPQLHQLDQFGDSSGFYESGEKMLSLHHYKSWHTKEPATMHVVIDACGEDCFLQRFQTQDNYIITNGFSVVQYPEGIDFDPLLVEETFEGAEGDTADVSLTYAFGGLRPSLNYTGKKKGWDLISSRQEGDGRVRQIYFKSKEDIRWVKEGTEPAEYDSVVVLLWVP